MIIDLEELKAFPGLADYIDRAYLSEPARYRNLFRLILRHKCRRLVEIGVFDGLHAVQMIETAMIVYGDDVVYSGFDLFEDLDQTTFEAEFSKKPPPVAEVVKRLNRTGACVWLYKGNTRETLPEQMDYIRSVDFIFIDGGHSIETIRSDWSYIEQSMGLQTIVVFDDYYIDAPADIAGMGCNGVIDVLDREQYDVEFLEPVDEFEKRWGTLKIQMVKVMLR